MSVTRVEHSLQSPAQVIYHWAKREDRVSIQQLGLLVRHPDQAESCAEVIGNPAGAGVYGYAQLRGGAEWHGWDCWKVDVESYPLAVDPWGEDVGGECYVIGEPVSADHLELVGCYDHEMRSFHALPVV